MSTSNQYNEVTLNATVHMLHAGNGRKVYEDRKERNLPQNKWQQWSEMATEGKFKQT